MLWRLLSAVVNPALGRIRHSDLSNNKDNDMGFNQILTIVGLLISIVAVFFLSWLRTRGCYFGDFWFGQWLCQSSR
ncbi:MAG: hypothetical protein CM15mP74_05650 [Halieaceae bacterium]|nr:MAG: hypothetical protein CM15mP74_05650 [Halieaceae bacterium]